MARVAYVNGRFVPHHAARVHVEDRGFQFADGVYEVVAVQGGRLIDEDGHLNRLDRSLGEMAMAWPLDRRVLMLLMRQMIRRNRLTDGLVYIQVTRGTAPRDFRFPPPGTRPTLVMTARRLTMNPRRQLEEGIAVITIPDIRWKRRDIKSVSLLPQVLGKQKATEEGAFEAWQVDDEGLVTEGCSSNAWIVTKDGVLVTRAPSSAILNGITRQSVLRLAQVNGIVFEQRAFTVEEAYLAREAFITSATNYIMPVTRIDNRPIADGRPGLLGRQLRQAYQDYADGPGAS